jgi:hypothetical protein
MYKSRRATALKEAKSEGFPLPLVIHLTGVAQDQKKPLMISTVLRRTTPASPSALMEL